MNEMSSLNEPTYEQAQNQAQKKMPFHRGGVMVGHAA
jgi:hypothetical protein